MRIAKAAESNIVGRDRADDLDVLADAFFENLEREERCEYGGWGLDDKRPFGNSYVEGDILEMLKVDPEWIERGDDRPTWSKEQEDYANRLYSELGAWLQTRWSNMRVSEKESR